jgi:hypothetical protein
MTDPAQKPIIHLHPTAFEPSPDKHYVCHLTYEPPLLGMPECYKVQTINDTVWYVPGDRLSRAIVADLGKRPNWTCQIVGDNIWMTILNVISKIPVPPVMP